MARYIVTLAIYGSADFCVDAKTEEEAIEKARSGEWDADPEVEAWDIAKPARGAFGGLAHHAPRVTIYE